MSTEPKIIDASLNGNLDDVKAEFDKKIHVDTPNINQNSPLICASINGHSEIVEFLLEKNAFINWVNLFGSTALIVSSSYGHLAVVKLLIEKKAIINITNIFGSSALIYAAIGGHLEVAKLLIQSGANLHLRDNNGFTAKEIAQHKGHTEVAELLEEAERKDPKRRSQRSKQMEDRVSELESQNKTLHEEVCELRKEMREIKTHCATHHSQLIGHLCGETAPEMQREMQKWCEEHPIRSRQTDSQSATELRNQTERLCRDAKILARNLEFKSKIEKLLKERERDKQRLMKAFQNHFKERWIESATVRAAERVSELHLKLETEMAVNTTRRSQLEMEVGQLWLVGKRRRSFLVGGSRGTPESGAALIGVRLCEHKYLCASCKLELQREAERPMSALIGVRLAMEPPHPEQLPTCWKCGRTELPQQ